MISLILWFTDSLPLPRLFQWLKGSYQMGKNQLILELGHKDLSLWNNGCLPW